MSTTFYDSPDGADPSLAIDVTPDFVWFFEHSQGKLVGTARVRKEELPAIGRAILEYLSVRDS